MPTYLEDTTLARGDPRGKKWPALAKRCPAVAAIGRKVMDMKPIHFLLPLVLAAGVCLAAAELKGRPSAKELMREKLELSQKLLEALATEDYSMMIAKSSRLSSISREAGWRQFENPDYDQQSLAFRRQAEALTRAASNKNLDAATLAYVRMTMSCVDCHKLIRGKPLARIEAPRKQFPF